MPRLISALELQVWQKSGFEHKPATALDEAGSAGPEDLAVFTRRTGAGASMYTDTCASTSKNSIAGAAFRLGWPWTAMVRTVVSELSCDLHRLACVLVLIKPFNFEICLPLGSSGVILQAMLVKRATAGGMSACSH